MSIEIQIPLVLREYAHCSAKLQSSAATVRAALEQLDREYPALYRSICDETGMLRRHINLFVNSRWVAVREPQGLDTPLAAGDVLTIFPAVSGG